MKFNLSKKSIIISVVVLISVAIAVGYYTLSNRSLSATELKQQALNNTVPITVRDIEKTIYTSGNIKSKNVTTVLSETSGVVREIVVSVGENVTEGQVLARLNLDDITEQIEQRELTFEIDKNNYQQAQRDAEQLYEDAVKLFEENEALYLVDAISRNEYEKSRMDLEKAEEELVIDVEDDIPTSLEIRYLQYKQSEASLQELYEELENTTIRSPNTGTITSINISETAYVNARSVLFEISDLSELEIVASVGEYEVNDLQVGMPVVITGEAFQKTYSGTLTSIAAAATISGSETTVDIVIDISDETSELKPNFTANADIVIASAKGVLTVPIDAVNIMPSGKKVVSVKVGDTTKPIHVQTGVEDDLYIQIITNELQEGDEVVSGSKMDVLGNGAVRPGGMMPGQGGFGGKMPRGGK